MEARGGVPQARGHMTWGRSRRRSHGASSRVYKVKETDLAGREIRKRNRIAYNRRLRHDGTDVPPTSENCVRGVPFADLAYRRALETQKGDLPNEKRRPTNDEK